ncbi:MAG: glycosyltransferase family 87 protein [Verrucomicrobiota bacterium]
MLEIQHAYSENSRAMRVLLTILALTSLSFTLWFTNHISEDATNGTRPYDFVKYYITSWNLRTDVSIYSPLATSEELETKIGWSHQDGSRAADPPTLALVTYPLSFLSYTQAWWLVASISCISLISSIYFTMRHYEHSIRRSLEISLIPLSCFPMLVMLILNHIESLLLPLGVAGWLLLKRSHPLASLFWSSAIALKLFPGMWLIGLAGARHRQQTISVLIFTSVLILTSVLIIGPDNIKVFLLEVIPQSKDWVFSLGNVSIKSFLAILLPTSLSNILYLLVFIGVSGFVLLKARSPDRIYTLGASSSLILSPLSWSYYFVIMIPPLIILAHHLNLKERKQRYHLVFSIFALLYFPSQLGGFLPENHMNNVGYILFNFIPCIALGHYTYLANKYIS